MQGLWADGWFYLSAASLLLSGILFFFLLGQYRAAVEAADRAEDDGDVGAPAASQPISAPAGSSALPVAKVASAKDKKEITTPLPDLSVKADATAPIEPKKEPAAAAPDSSAHGINPGVLYLQNIKVQLDQLNASVSDLTKRVDSIGGRDQALIERLGELSNVIAQLKGAGAPAQSPDAAAVAPAARKHSKKTESPTAATVSVPIADKTIVSLDENVRVELDNLIENQMVEKAGKLASGGAPIIGIPLSQPDAPAAQIEQPKPDEPDPDVVVIPPTPALEEESEKPRRGPVWPV